MEEPPVVPSTETQGEAERETRRATIILLTIAVGVLGAVVFFNMRSQEQARQSQLATEERIRKAVAEEQAKSQELRIPISEADHLAQVLWTSQMLLVPYLQNRGEKGLKLPEDCGVEHYEQAMTRALRARDEFEVRDSQARLESLRNACAQRYMNMTSPPLPQAGRAKLRTGGEIGSYDFDHHEYWIPVYLGSGWKEGWLGAGLVNGRLVISELVKMQCPRSVEAVMVLGMDEPRGSLVLDGIGENFKPSPHGALVRLPMSEDVARSLRTKLSRAASSDNLSVDVAFGLKDQPFGEMPVGCESFFGRISVMGYAGTLIAYRVTLNNEHLTGWLHP